MTAGRLVIAGLAVVLLLLQFRLWVGEGSLGHVDGLQQRVEQKRAQNAVREQRNRVLRAEIKELKTGVDVLEEKARTEFGLIKEGETFFLVIDDADQPAVAP